MADIYYGPLYKSKYCVNNTYLGDRPHSEGRTLSVSQFSFILTYFCTLFEGLRQYIDPNPLICLITS